MIVPSQQAPIGVAVVGCGLIGRRRAQVARASDGSRLVIVADVASDKSSALAAEAGCLASTDWQEAARRDDVDVVVVSTTNDWLAPIAAFALEQGKHVLVEKPMARTAREARQLVRAAPGDGVDGQSEASQRPGGGMAPVVGVGFNHRHHPGIRRAHELLVEGVIGEPISIRCRYGHGGRPGYEAEWRSNREVSGGGELLDQGIHAIDLFRWFLGDLREASGFVETYAWGGDGPRSRRVEDNAFALFRTGAGKIASLHASWTQWKNLFSFEIFGQLGYLVVDGLGGSYGCEQLRVGRRNVAGGPPREECVEFPGEDHSWESEWREFLSAIHERRDPLASGKDGLLALTAVEGVYESAMTGQVVKLDGLSSRSQSATTAPPTTRRYSGRDGSTMRLPRS